MMHGKRKELEKLYREYHPMVFQMCLGFVKGDQELADDLAQEVFINVWNGLSKFKASASYKTWIYRITVNTCLQYIRKEKRREDVSVRLSEEAISTEADARKEQNDQTLYHSIGQLKEMDRLIIMMVLEEQDYEEISKVIGISEASLRVKIHRIKKRLKKIIENG